MSLKQGALKSRLHGGDPEAYAEAALETLRRYHSMAVDHFTGDECLSGDSPIQGTELCGVVETMYSYETLLSVSGGAKWGDRLERLAFNALPATLSEDMWTHQYLQMTNQPECSILQRTMWFSAPTVESPTFSAWNPISAAVPPISASGWPKLALSAFQRTEKGLASAGFGSLPGRNGDWRRSRSPAGWKPNIAFHGKLKYTVETARANGIHLAVGFPGFAVSAAVDGNPVSTGGFTEPHRCWEGVQTVEVGVFFCLLPHPAARGDGVPVARSAALQPAGKGTLGRSGDMCGTEWKESFPTAIMKFLRSRHGTTDLPGKIFTRGAWRWGNSIFP